MLPQLLLLAALQSLALGIASDAGQSLSLGCIKQTLTYTHALASGVDT